MAQIAFEPAVPIERITVVLALDEGGGVAADREERHGLMSFENLLRAAARLPLPGDFQARSAAPASGSEPTSLCSGAFAECTGLEATMEPKVIKEGGRNYGAAQRVGPVSFATVVLKRGMTTTRDLWKWFQLVAGGAYAYRLSAEITMQDTAGEAVLAWRLRAPCRSSSRRRT